MTVLIFPSSPVDGQIYPPQRIPNVEQYKWSSATNTWELLPPDGIYLIETGTGLEGGPIVNEGTISIADTGVIEGSYTNANITINAQGQITEAENGEPAILESIIDNTGDLIVGQTADTPAILPVGNDGQALIADSLEPLGVRWGDVAGSGTIETLTFTTQVLAPGQTQDFWVEIGTLLSLISLSVTASSEDAWVRVYTSYASQQADTRLAPGPPFPSGLAAEIVTTSLNPSVTFLPVPEIYTDSGLFVRITNQSASTQSFSVDFTRLASVETPCDQPPFGNNIYINTSCVTDFTGAWQGGTFSDFPEVDLSNGTVFDQTWSNCSNLVTFPPGMFDNCSATDFQDAWLNCALSQQSVDNILISLDTAGQSGGTVDITGGTSFNPGVAGTAAKISLEGKGWTVNVNPTVFIYCTPAYPLLPVTFPPYSCNTAVNTAGVTDFTGAWSNCYSITTFPCVDSSAVTLFTDAWSNCQYMTTFPVLNTSLVTDFTRAWFNCYLLDNFPVLNFQSGLDFTYSWGYCYAMSSFPAVDLSSGSIFYSSWSSCTSLTTFPPLDLSSGTDFTYAWYNCTGLTSFPNVDVSSGTNFESAWRYCTGLTSFPVLNTSQGTNFTASWRYCSGLTSFPSGIDLSPGTSFILTWNYCSALTSFPALDLSLGLDFSGAWSYCTGLTSMGAVNVSSGTNFQSAWEFCSSLTSFPSLNVSSGTNFQAAWQGCSSLTSFPSLNTGSGTDFTGSWKDCTSLTSFPSLDFGSSTLFYRTWLNCTSLTSFPSGLFNVSSATDFTEAWKNCALDQISVDNVLVSLDVAGQLNGIVDISGGTSSAPGVAGSAAALSLQGKGWTVTTN